MYMKKHIGDRGERLVAEYYRRNGYVILGRNVHTTSGEIDIIAQKKKNIVFIEVKTRTSVLFGYPEESIDEAKKDRIFRCSSEYLEMHNIKESLVVHYHICALRLENNRVFIKIYTDI